MSVNINAIIKTMPKKNDILKQLNKKEEFKKVLDSQELRTKNSSDENDSKKYSKAESLQKISSPSTDKANNENQKKSVGSTLAEESNTQDTNKLDDNSKIKVEIINFIEMSMDKLKQDGSDLSKELEGTDKSAEEMAQIQQLLQFLSSMFKSNYEDVATKNQGNETNAIDLEQLIDREELTLDTKSMLKSNLSEIVELLEKLNPNAKGVTEKSFGEGISLLEKSKSNNEMSSEILNVIQKLTTEVKETNGDLNLLKVASFQTAMESSEGKSVKDDLLKKVVEQSTKPAFEGISKNQMQSSNDATKDNKSSGNNSFEEKFLNSFLSEDKDEAKISKAVNFMNQFEPIKTLDSAKVQVPNIVIDKNNIEADVIKTIKFMEINNVKNLTVKMNPKELGEITIKLTMESGIMKANISAQNKDTYNLLNHNIQDISDKLKNMDIKIQSLDINIYEDSTFFSKDSNEKNNNGKQNNNSKTNMILEEEDISISNNYAIEENQVNKFV